MPLIQLDKIILHRTVAGPECPACHTPLQELPADAYRAKHYPWWTFWRSRPPKIISYKCPGCGKRYQLTEKP